MPEVAPTVLEQQMSKWKEEQKKIWQQKSGSWKIISNV